MHKLVLGSAALLLACLALPIGVSTPARAEVEYPWCGFAREGGGSCSFSTYEQCQMFVSGTGGACRPNNRYTAPPAAAPRRRR